MSVKETETLWTITFYDWNFVHNSAAGNAYSRPNQNCDICF